MTAEERLRWGKSSSGVAVEESGQVSLRATTGATSWKSEPVGQLSGGRIVDGMPSPGRREVGDLWQWVMVLVLVAMTMSAVNLPRIQEFGLTIRYPLAVLLLLLTLRWGPSSTAAGESQGSRRSMFVFGLAGCVVAALLSTVSHPEVSWVAVLPLVVLLAVPAALVQGRWRDGVPVGDLRVVAATSGVLVTISLLTGLAGLPFAVGVGESTADILESGEGRISGLYGNPNALGLVAMVSATLCAAAAVVTRRRGLYTIFTVCALLALILSQSRTAQLAFVVSALLVLLVAGWKRGVGALPAWVLLPFLMGGALLLGATALLPQRFQAALARFGENAGGSRFNGRERMWEASFHAWNQRPFNGHGYSYSGEVMDHLVAQGWNLPVRSAHQSYLQWGVETGWLGFVPLGIAVLAVLWGLVSKGQDSAWTTGLQCAVLAGFVSMMAESVMFGTGFTFSWMFWFACAAVVVGKVRPPSADADRPGRR